MTAQTTTPAGLTRATWKDHGHPTDATYAGMLASRPEFPRRVRLGMDIYGNLLISDHKTGRTIDRTSPRRKVWLAPPPVSDRHAFAEGNTYLPTEGRHEWLCAECGQREGDTAHGDLAAPEVAEDDLAFDGSNAPPSRDLTARDRDVLCRVLGFVIRDDRYRLEDLPRLAEIREVIDPRREAQASDMGGLVAHDFAASAAMFGAREVRGD